MANADAVLPSPNPPPPAWRIIAASLVRNRRALAVAAAAAVIYLILATIWLLFASLGVMRIGRAACGEGCSVVAAALEILRGATVSVAPLTLVGVVAAGCFISIAASNTEAEKAPAPKDFTPAERPVLCVLMFRMLAYLPFVLLILVSFLLKAVSSIKGSHRERTGSVIIDVGVLSLVALNCFIVLPALALYVWKVMLVMRQRI